MSAKPLRLKQEPVLKDLMDVLVTREDQRAECQWLSHTTSEASKCTSLDVVYIAQLELILKCWKRWPTATMIDRWKHLCEWGREHGEQAITRSTEPAHIVTFLADRPEST